MTNQAPVHDYPNPLDNFRTYSYHFILTLSSTSQAIIDQIGDTSGVGASAPLMSALTQVNNLGDKIRLNQSDVYLLIDTRRFSQYSITNLKMSHVYGTGDKENPTTPVAAHEMQIIDTTGISLFNTLMDLFRNKIQSTRFSAFFLLAISFVGHRDDGTTETITTTFVPMMLLTMGLKFDASGSVFDLTFMEQEGGIERGGAGTNQINFLGNCNSITTLGFSNNIGGALDALEQDLNIRSIDYYQKYASAQSAAGQSGQPGKLVQYMITAPKEWRQFPIDTAETSSNQEKMYVATIQSPPTSKQPAKAPVKIVPITPIQPFSSFKFSDATTIPDAIKIILESSSKILNLANTTKFSSGQAIAFKIVTTMTSDATTYVVHYDIYPYYLPLKESAPSGIVQTGASSQQSDINQFQNVITYNYLYSGQNSSVIDLAVKFSPDAAVQALDTNINIGSQRFNQISQLGQVQSNISQAATGEKSATGTYAPDIRPNDPLFFSLKSKDQRNNNASQKTSEAVTPSQALSFYNSKQQFMQTIASVHFLSNMQLDMVIRGNPNIIAKFADRNARGGCPPHGQIITAEQLSTLIQAGQGSAEAAFSSISKTLKSAKDAYYTTYYYPRIAAVLSPTSNPAVSPDTLLNGPDVAVYPIYVLIKIFAPNVDSTGNFITNAPMFTDQFFYNGIYRLLLLETNFHDGDFTHGLTLFASNGVTSQNDIPSEVLAND